MTDATYADRLRETLALKIKLRDVFTSPGLIEDNERQIHLVQNALRVAEKTCCLRREWAPADRGQALIGAATAPAPEPAIIGAFFSEIYDIRRQDP